MAKRKQLTIQSELAGRALMAAAMGLQFGGERDVYAAAGYDRVILPAHFMEMWRRGDVAKRIVNIYPDETWRLTPTLLDNGQGLAQAPDNPFLQAWQQVATGGQLLENGETRIGLMAHLHRLDQMAGIGRYGVMLFGLRDNKALSEPIEAGSMAGPQDLLYVECYPEVYAKVTEIDNNPASPRYKKPVRYQLVTSGGQETAIPETVHWTRTMHVAEGGGEIYGVPRLEAVWNRLFDVLKVMAATGEAAWRLMLPGYVFEADPEHEQPDADSEEWQTFRATVDDFVHNLRRWMVATGMKATELSGNLQDPGPSMEWNLNLISATTGIPKRLLMGSEQGELASSQDDENWADVVESRQNNHAWPRILLPTINKLIWYGVLPAATGTVGVKWAPLMKRNTVQINDAADKAASALQKAGLQAEPEAFVAAYLPDLDASRVTVAPLTGSGSGVLAANGAGEVMTPAGVPFRDEWAGYP